MATVHHERQRHSSFITTIPTITASLQEEPNSSLLDTAIASHLLRCGTILKKTQCQRGSHGCPTLVKKSKRILNLKSV